MRRYGEICGDMRRLAQHHVRVDIGVDDVPDREVESTQPSCMGGRLPTPG